MKAFFEIMMADYRSEGFSRADWVKYGIIAPIIYVILTAIVWVKFGKTLKAMRANIKWATSEGCVKKGSMITQHQGNNGYMRAKIFDKYGQSKMALVHRLVAQAFIPNTDNLPEVNHKNEDKTDNRAENLEWCTGSYNVTYNDLQTRRYNNGGGRRKRPVEQLTMDGQFVARFDSVTEAAEAVGTSVAHIWNVCDGRQKSSCGYRWRFAE